MTAHDDGGRAATAEEVRAFMAGMDDVRYLDNRIEDHRMPFTDHSYKLALRVIRAQRAAIQAIVAARLLVWESVEGTANGYAAHDELRKAIAGANAMLGTATPEQEKRDVE